jgi:hypothetical protein
VVEVRFNVETKTPSCLRPSSAVARRLPAEVVEVELQRLSRLCAVQKAAEIRALEGGSKSPTVQLSITEDCA